MGIIIFYLKKGILDSNFKKVLKKEINYSSDLYYQFKKLSVSFYFLPINKEILKNKEISKEYKQNLLKNIILLDFKKELENLLVKNKLDYLFYKGAFTAENIYENIAQRFLSDIDLLINEKQLKKVKKLIDNNFNITKYKKNKSFYTNEYRFYENEFLIKHKGYEISIDLHIGFIQKAKFNIEYSIIFKENKIEHQMIAMIIQISNDYFINTEKKFLDLYLIIKKENINWNYLLKLINQFKINKITYLIFYILINELDLKNIPINNINLKKYEKFILNNMIMTKTFRINQIFLFYYTFDELRDYKKFLNDKLLKTRKNGIEEVIRSLKKIK